MSDANSIALALSAVLEKIKKVDGFETDIGLRVMRGRRRLGPEQLPCAVLIEQPDVPKNQLRNGAAQITLKFIVEGHSECDPDNPNDMAHKMIADIKRAVFGHKFTYGASNSPFLVTYGSRTISPREDGMAIVSTGVEISIEYVENLSNP